MKRYTYLILTLFLAFNVSANPKEDPSNTESIISAQVIDKESGEFLTGVCVIINGEKSNIYTDFDGYFELSLDSDVKEIELSLVSYNKKSITAGELLVGSKLQIELDPR